MKRLVAIVCAFVMCLGLFGCAGSAAAPGGLADGSYEVTAETDSSMFRIEKCVLVVKDGQVTAQASLPGKGFSRLFFGSPEDAAKASDDEIYDYYLNDAGLYTFDIPVSALDQELEVAAYGHRRDTWYPHTIVVHAPTGEPLPAESASAAAADAAAPAAGEYHVDVTLDGGTGRATIESPAKIVVADGKMTLTVVWSSPNYDQMVVDGTQYLPVNTSGNSTFEIPVETLDADLAVQAETTAMSEPHMIDYTIHFDAGSLK